jgi:hypothetical protein
MNKPYSYEADLAKATAYVKKLESDQLARGHLFAKECEDLEQAGWRKWENRAAKDDAGSMTCRECVQPGMMMRGFRRGQEEKAFAICPRCGFFFEF